MKLMLIQKVSSLENYDLSLLIEESLSEGHQFVKRLVDEYKNGTNRFEKNGEALFIALHDSKAIGIGGLNVDPYRDEIDIGRVRHLYVSRKHRGRRVGRELLNTIIDEAKKHFATLTLSTNNPIADQLYIKSGFSRAEGIHKASHVMKFPKGQIALDTDKPGSIASDV